jgi:hypothetical protein
MPFPFIVTSRSDCALRKFQASRSKSLARAQRAAEEPGLTPAEGTCNPSAVILSKSPSGDESKDLHFRNRDPERKTQFVILSKSPSGDESKDLHSPGKLGRGPSSVLKKNSSS